MAMAVNMALMALNKVCSPSVLCCIYQIKPEHMHTRQFHACVLTVFDAFPSFQAGIFCTEPYRVPLAGKVSHCLFDKTGTLTTDQLVPVGIVNHNSRTTASPASSSAAREVSSLPLLHRDLPALGEVITATAETALILAACHSLVVVDDSAAEGSTLAAAAQSSNPNLAEAEAVAAAKANANLVGDPIELAAIKGIDWSWDAVTSTASPTGGVHRCTLALSLARHQLKQLEAVRGTTPKEKLPPGHEQKIDSIRKEIPILEGKLKEAVTKSSTAMYSSAQVLQRHHFSSKLQRMSVVCRCETAKGGECGNRRNCAVGCYGIRSLCGGGAVAEMLCNVNQLVTNQTQWRHVLFPVLRS
jgi:cation-transporting ATPase 13A1